MIPALFVSLSGPDTGVFESQVMEYGQFAKSLGIEFRYLLFEGIRAGLRANTRLKRNLAELGRRYDARIELRYLPGPLTSAGLHLAAYSFAQVARSISTGGPILIQARGGPAACAALMARRKVGSLVVLYDVRGDEVAEARLEGTVAETPTHKRRWERRAQRIELLQRQAAAGADHVLVVSTPLRAKLCALAGISPARVTVVPCCVNPARFARPPQAREAMRRRLGVTDRFVVVYSGSLGLYQIPDRIAALMTALHARMPAAHLLVLTRDRAGAHRHCGTLVDQGAATIYDAPFDAVGDYLAAADAALLLRQDDPVNRVACPVKFAEYQIAGLPVIATPSIGDVSDYLATTGYGVVVDLADPPERQAEMIDAIVARHRWPKRETISARALQKFSRESYRGTYESVLSDLGVVRSNSERREPARGLT